MSSENQSKFDLWWNSPKTKRIVGMMYSLGASIVIIGAMGKILHTSWGGNMLGVGMTVEAILFALGVFDKPHEEFDWNKVFDFETEEGKIKGGMAGHSQTQPSTVPHVNAPEISDANMQSLASGIKKLSETAEKLNSLGNVAGSTEKLIQSLDAASVSTDKFVTSQDSFINASQGFNSAFQDITTEMETVQKNTKTYAGKIDEINKNLTNLNSVYEVQLKNIQSQSELISAQTEKMNVASIELTSISDNLHGIQQISNSAAEKMNEFKSETEKLTSKIVDLNDVYGNMLNALS